MHAAHTLTLALLFLSAPASLATEAAAVAVAVVPLDDESARDVAHRAIFDAVSGALPTLASERGLSAKRFALVRPIDEAARACPRALNDLACLRAQTKRLGARYAVLTSLRAADGELHIALIDADANNAPLTSSARGTPAHVLASGPRVVEQLLERVAPRIDHQRALALARLVKARKADNHEAAARICFELAALLPKEMATWTFDGADSLADAGRTEEAAAIFAQLALDDSLDEDVRIEALARSRNPTGAQADDP